MALLGRSGVALLGRSVTPLLFVLGETVREQINLLASFQRQGLKRWSESDISTFFFHIHPLVSLAAAAGTVTAIRKKDIRFLIPAFLVGLVLAMQIRRIRYILPIFPLLALAAAYGIHQLQNRKLIRYLVISAIGASLILAIGLYLPFTKRLSAVNIQNAGLFLNNLESSAAAVYTEEGGRQTANLTINIPLLDLFTSKQVYSLNSTAPKPLPDKGSSFRFSWEQHLPSFYYPAGGALQFNEKALVIVSTLPRPRLPLQIEQLAARKSKKRQFTTSTGLFSYKTVVTIFYDE